MKDLVLGFLLHSKTETQYSWIWLYRNKPLFDVVSLFLSWGNYCLFCTYWCMRLTFPVLHHVVICGNNLTFSWVPPPQQNPILAVPVDKKERVGQENWISENNQLWEKMCLLNCRQGCIIAMSQAIWKAKKCFKKLSLSKERQNQTKSLSHGKAIRKNTCQI